MYNPLQLDYNLEQSRVVYQMQKKNMHSAFKVIILLFGRLLEDSDSYNSLFWLC